MNTTQLLEESRAIILDPEHWCQKWDARDAQGRKVDSNSDSAVSFCAGGAMDLVDRRHRDDELLSWSQPFSIMSGFRLLDQAARELFDRKDYLDVNDHGSHEMVIKMFDRAIELSKER